MVCVRRCRGGFVCNCVGDGWVFIDDKVVLGFVECEGNVVGEVGGVGFKGCVDIGFVVGKRNRELI